MNIACYLIEKYGTLKKALIPQEMILDLAISLRKNGSEFVEFANETVEIEGIFIPAKGTKHGMMVIPNMED